MTLRAGLFLVPLLLTAACSAVPVQPEHAAGAPLTSTPSVPIQNFAEVAPGIYRGAQPDEAGFRALRDMGVKTIINLRSFHDDVPKCDGLGMDVVNIPMYAGLSCPNPTDAQVRHFMQVVTDPSRRPVFVHCAHGVDRTGTMCAIYRMEAERWEPDRACEEMRTRGWHEGIYKGIGEFVRTYECRGLCPGETK